MTSRAHRCTAVTLLTVLALSPTTARGQGPARTAAAPPSAEDTVAALKKQGNDAMASLRPSEALEAYRKAYELSKEPSLLYNMGKALEAIGDYPGALARYEEFSRTAPPDLKARVPRLAELIADIKGHVTVVTIHCNVPGARVLVRDVAVGAIGADGMLTQAFPAGPATLEISADGYARRRQQASFARGASVTIDVELASKSTAGVLHIETTPVPGDVYIDDKEVGRSPVETSVTAGTHRIVVRHEGAREVTTQAVVVVGETKQLTIDLEKTPPLYTRWWFWSTVGVVIAGGVVLTYAELKERSPDQGSIPPRIVSPVGQAVFAF
jgi:hypothetical protein